MRTARLRKVAAAAVFVLAAFAALTAGSSGAAPAFQVLHGFGGPDGGSPNSLLQAADGSFYGSADLGGDTTACAPDGCGTLFKMDGAGNVTVLHTFHAGADGSDPTGLIQAPDGFFYGTTTSGRFFRMDTAGNLTTLYQFAGGFACCDGSWPKAQPVLGSDGNFYGTTQVGGAFRDIDHQTGFGTVYRFDPATSTMSILHSFDVNDANGIFPNGPLVQGTDGAFYGTTREGALGGGSVFKIDTAGTLTLVHAFSDNLSAAPLSGLFRAADGSLYGTTEGAIGAGSLYKIDTAGHYSLVNQFDGADGYRPHFRVLQGANGFLYGTSPEGGLLDFQGGNVFRFDTAGTVNVIHSFTIAGADGFSPNSDLIQASDGWLYGVTGIGGVNGHGTVFRFDPGAPGVVASITTNPSVVAYPNTSVGTVTLTSPAPLGGTVVTLGAQQGQIVIPASVTVPAGSRTANFTIQTMSILASADVRIYASVAGQGVRTVITVLPAAPGPHLSSLAVFPASVRGGRSATGTVRLNTPAPAGGAVVTITSNSTKAIVPTSVRVPAGATSVSFGVRTTFVMKTTVATIAAAYNGDTKTAALTITR